jgi:predicted transcriptional regulator
MAFMASTMVRISEKAGKTLKQLAAESGETMQSILDKALEDYKRKRFFDALDADIAALQADPAAWAEYKAETALWDATLMDGLDPHEQWNDDGTVTFRNQHEPEVVNA